MLDKVAYLQRMQEDRDWAPGWDAILAAFSVVYGTQRPELVPLEPALGMKSGLLGFAVFHSPFGYWHIVTRGLTRIYPHCDAYGCNESGYGFELTIKWPHEEDCKDAFMLLDRVAQFVEIRHNVFRRPSFLSFSGRMKYRGFNRYSDSFAGVLIVNDTEVEEVQSLHGHTGFLQLMNLTKGEVERLNDAYMLRDEMERSIKRNNPRLVIDFQRNNEG